MLSICTFIISFNITANSMDNVFKNTIAGDGLLGAFQFVAKVANFQEVVSPQKYFF
jgi:hypothetical protein